MRDYEAMESRLFYGSGIDPFPYQDVGCAHAPSCLSCPYALCAHDRPIYSQHRDAVVIQVRAAREAGVPWRDVVNQVGLSIRTLARMVEEG